MTIVKDKQIIVFGEDFNRHPHALEHLLRPMFSHNDFFWVETIGLRSPKLSVYDGKRIIEKFKSWFLPNKKQDREIPERLKIITPFMIPYNQFGLIRRFNAWNVKRSINQVLERNSERISIASVPQACDYIGQFKEQKTIYFCVDEFSLWPGYDLKLVKKLEDKLIVQADSICATADNLCLTKHKKGKKTELISHGVDFQHFKLPPSTRPIKNLCYFGLFDERSDLTLIKKMADKFFDCTIHIFGEVVIDCKWPDQKNILFHGKIAYKDLPQKIEAMDLFFIPYHLNELTKFINPLKLKEYLSTGRPVVSTALPEVIKWKKYAFIGKDHDEFLLQIENLITNKELHRPDEALKYIEQYETWDIKARQLSKIIEA